MRSRLIVAILVFVGVVIGAVLSLISAEAVHMTSDQKFCVVCHEMDPMVIAYKQDVHGGEGKLGGSAHCTDCHLPQTSVTKYFFQKARNGLVEGAIHFFGNPDEIDWYKKRKHREEFVFDSGCLRCHENMEENPTASKQAKKMHAHYRKLKDTDKEIKCVQCHIDAGHKGMRNILNHYKPEFKLYRYKMEDEKMEDQEKYKKYGIQKDKRKLKKDETEHKPTG